jgi:hypothetical protein
MHSLESQQGERWVKGCLCILFGYYKCSSSAERLNPPRSLWQPSLTITLDKFSYLPEADYHCSPAIYRFCFLVEVFMQRISSECRASSARQA